MGERQVSAAVFSLEHTPASRGSPPSFHLVYSYGYPLIRQYDYKKFRCRMKSGETVRLRNPGWERGKVGGRATPSSGLPLEKRLLSCMRPIMSSHSFRGEQSLPACRLIGIQTWRYARHRRSPLCTEPGREQPWKKGGVIPRSHAGAGAVDFSAVKWSRKSHCRSPLSPFAPEYQRNLNRARE